MGYPLSLLSGHQYNLYSGGTLTRDSRANGVESGDMRQPEPLGKRIGTPPGGSVAGRSPRKRRLSP